MLNYSTFASYLKIVIKNNMVKAGKTYVTSTKNSNHKWIKGSLVNIVIINGVEHLKTTGNNTEKDNLDNLPEF